MAHWRSYKDDADDKLLKDICHNCGSEAMKGAYNYFRCAKFYSKWWCEIYDDKGFYFATVARNHARLIAIAVRNEHKGQGLGREILYRLLRRLSGAGLDTLTFRTPMNEEAQYFWLKQGAKIMDVKGNDYEMQIKLIKTE